MRVVSLEPFGAELDGIDLTQAPTESVADSIRELLQVHQILVFRNQPLAATEQLALTNALGDAEPSIAKRPPEHQVPGATGVLYLSNERASSTTEYGFGWHSDGLAYARVPHALTMLNCKACPPGVGDTLFANQYIAYDLMADNLRAELGRLRWELPELEFSEVPEGRALVHPIVRSHPGTGRTFVFFAPQARRIRGRTKAASAELLDLVREHQVREACVYRHRWKPDDLVLWENCALLHNRADRVDPSQGERIMHRTAVRGDFSAKELPASPS